MPEVIVTISPDGAKVTTDANGFVGGACHDLMKSTLDALGTIEEEKKKPEYYLTQGTGVKVGA